MEGLKRLIKDSRVLVLSKTYCPYCAKAKTALLSNGVKDAVVLELDVIDNGATLQKAAQELTGQRTVPNIWIGGKHIGGSDSLASFISAGKFPAALAEADKLKNASAGI